MRYLVPALHTGTGQEFSKWLRSLDNGRWNRQVRRGELEKEGGKVPVIFRDDALHSASEQIAA